MGNDAGRGLSRRGAGRAPPFVRRGAVSARELGRPPWPCAPQLSPCPLGGLETEGGLAFPSARQTVKRAPEGGRWLEAARASVRLGPSPGRQRERRGQFLVTCARRQTFPLSPYFR